MSAHELLDLAVTPVGVVHSSVVDRKNAPKMEHEGGVEAEIEIHPQFRDAMLGLHEGQPIILLTWLHLSNRKLLQVHPRADKSRPLQGIFNTRSPTRPNPIGLHLTTIVKLTPEGITVFPLEVLDGTPIVDIKPQRTTPPGDPAVQDPA